MADKCSVWIWCRILSFAPFKQHRASRRISKRVNEASQQLVSWHGVCEIMDSKAGAAAVKMMRAKFRMEQIRGNEKAITPIMRMIGEPLFVSVKHLHLELTSQPAEGQFISLSETFCKLETVRLVFATNIFWDLEKPLRLQAFPTSLRIENGHNIDPVAIGDYAEPHKDNHSPRILRLETSHVRGPPVLLWKRLQRHLPGLVELGLPRYVAGQSHINTEQTLTALQNCPNLELLVAQRIRPLYNVSAKLKRFYVMYEPDSPIRVDPSMTVDTPKVVRKDFATNEKLKIGTMRIRKYDCSCRFAEDERLFPVPTGDDCVVVWSDRSSNHNH